METKKMKLGTIIRTILQVLTYINQIVAIVFQTIGKTDNPVYLWISVIITVIVTTITYWYNNDWSNLAKTTSEVFDMVKDGKITKEELDNFINNHKK